MFHFKNNKGICSASGKSSAVSTLCTGASFIVICFEHTNVYNVLLILIE